MNALIRISAIFLCLFIFSACDVRYGFVESELSLAKDSRLPKWITLPVGITRNEVNVDFTFYTLGKVKVRLYKENDKDDPILTEVATLRWTKETKRKGFYEKPIYFFLSVNGVDELFEQRSLEPLIYVSDKNIK